MTPVCFQVTAIGSCSHACASVSKQYNLVPAYGQWCCSAGKVAAAPVESSGHLLLGGWLKVTCGLTVCTLKSAPCTMLRIEYRKTLHFSTLRWNYGIPNTKKLNSPAPVASIWAIKGKIKWELLHNGTHLLDTSVEEFLHFHVCLDFTFCVFIHSEVVL